MTRYLVSLNYNGLGLAAHAAVNLVSDTHAHFVHPGERESNLSDLRTQAGGEVWLVANLSIL